MDSFDRAESVESRVEQFMALYSGHQRRLYLYAITLLPDANAAEDVLQEANLVLWRKFDSFTPGSNFFAWACQIIRYEVLKHRQRRSRAAALFDPDVLDRLADVAVEQFQRLDEPQRRALADCMDRLSPGDRELMRRRYDEAMAVQDIAAAMDRSPNAVSQSLGRVRRLLLDCLGNTLSDRPRQGGDQ
jgi:RNA polymerase sigma-70 factor (ECF subfamily)